MMMPVARFAWILVLTLALSASTVVRLDVGQLSQLATNIVGGQITNITPEKDSDNGYIYSNVTMQVSHAIPSTLAGHNYQFRMVGGELNGKRLHIAGLPQFRVGQDVVLFLNSQPEGVFGPTVGLWQGVFFVERDAATGMQTVSDHQRRPILGVGDQRFVVGLPRTGEHRTAVASGSSSSGLAIDQFFDRIRTLRFSPSTR